MGGDPAGGDRHVHHGVDAVARVDDMAALEQQVVGWLRARSGHRHEDGQQRRPASDEKSGHV